MGWTDYGNEDRRGEMEGVEDKLEECSCYHVFFVEDDWLSFGVFSFNWVGCGGFSWAGRDWRSVLFIVCTRWPLKYI
jgi:hypothetical protein